MSTEAPTSVAKSVAAKTLAAKPPLSETVDHLNKVLPTVVETAEMALEVPSKVVVNQKTVVILGVLGGVAIGAGIVYGVTKLRERKLAQKVKKALEETVETAKVVKNNAKA